MNKTIDEQICEFYLSSKEQMLAGRLSFKDIAKHFEVDVSIVHETLGRANLIRRSKVVPIGTLVACRRFGGAPHKLARVVRPCKVPGSQYYIVCGMNNITHWSEWSGAMDDPKTVVCSGCKCDNKVLTAFGCQCEDGKKITRSSRP